MDARPLSVCGHVLLHLECASSTGRPFMQDYRRLCLFVEVWLSFRLRIACERTCMFDTVWICFRQQIACACTYIWVRVQIVSNSRLRVNVLAHLFQPDITIVSDCRVIVSVRTRLQENDFCFGLQSDCARTYTFARVWLRFKLQSDSARTYMFARVPLSFGLQIGCTRTCTFWYMV